MRTRLTSRAVFMMAMAAGLLATPASAQPDLRSMSGMALPSPELPDGSVSVRVVRGQITNNLPGIAVELHGAGDVRRATTGADGRAQFDRLPAGSRVHAVATIDGVRLESHELEVPPKGGVRTLLAAQDGAAGAPESTAAAPAAPAPGAAPSSTGGRGLSLGGNSRVAMEFSDDVLQVFYLLEIVNPTAAPITPSSALIFDMPVGAEGTTLLEGSTKQANAKGTRVTVTGPFPPGVTPLQVAFRLDTMSSERMIAQAFPLPLDMVAFAVQKVGDMKVSSPQASRTQESPIEASMFVMGTGPALAAGSPLQIHLSGVPHHSRMPAYVALGLAALLIGAGAWASFSPAPARDAERQQLERRREQGLAHLADLEGQHRSGAIDDRQYESRRASLLAQLEQVYGALDTTGGGAGGQGVAA
jgi:hypothetical protein